MRYKVQKTVDDGRPIPEDEPCLVIRAQDVLAPVTLWNYLGMYVANNGLHNQVVAELANHLSILLHWQHVNQSKVKVADR